MEHIEQAAREEMLERVLDSASIDEAAATIEAQLPPEAITPELLAEVRSTLLVRAYSSQPEAQQQATLRGMLFSARSAPASVAAATDIYGLWLARSNFSKVEPDLLRVAAWAYHWSQDGLGRARALVNLADALFVRDRFEEAKQATLEAEALFEAYGLLAGVVRSRLVRANVLYELQQPNEAIALYGSLVDMIDPNTAEGNDLSRYIEALNGLAMTAEDLQDDFDGATAYFQQALELLPRTEWQAAPAFRLYLNQGWLQMRLGRHGDARRFFDRAEEWLHTGIAQEWLTPADEYDLRLAQITLALLLDDRGRADTYLQSLRRLESKGEHSPKQLAEVTRFTALLSSSSEDALVLLSDAAQQFEQLGTPLLAVACWSELAERAFITQDEQRARQALSYAHILLGSWQAPRRLLELERIAAQYDEQVPSSERESVAHRLANTQDYLGCAGVWESLGAGYERSKQPAAAYRAYLAAIEAAEQARGLVRLGVHSLLLLAARRRAYERAVVLAPGPEEALQIGERARAQVLLDELNNAAVWRLLDRAELAQIRAAYERFTYERARLSLHETRVRRPGLDSEVTNDGVQSGEAHQAERAYFAALEQLQVDKLPELGWVIGKANTLHEICSTLPPTSLLASYTLVDLPDSSEQELWVTTLASNGVVQTKQAQRRGSWKLFQRSWAGNPLMNGNLALPDSEAQSPLTELYAAFIAPIQRQLEQAQYFIVALDERLPLYPLHAAYNGNGSYLVEQVSVSYIPSGSVLTTLRRRHQNRVVGGDALLVGWDALGYGGGFPVLREVQAGLGELAELFGSDPWYGPLETDELLRRAGNAPLIHIHCHGEFPTAGSPRFANLLLGPQRLYADDLYRATMPAHLLFLNACHVGQHGQGLQGFVSAALVSGASAVVAAMWQVQESVGRRFAGLFYSHWRAGATNAQATQAAQRALIAEHIPPGFWAAFHLVGLPDLEWPFRSHS